MAKITVDSRAMDALLRKFKSVENVAAALAPEADLIQTALLDDAQAMPTKSPGAFTRLATPGQRRAYWAKVARGEARHGANGYVRSNRLSRDWRKTAMRVTATNITFGVENLNSGQYAQYVQGAYRQPFHRQSGWKTDAILARVHRDSVRKRIERRIERIITG